jgi:hypothetical protein
MVMPSQGELSGTSRTVAFAVGMEYRTARFYGEASDGNVTRLT